MKTFKEQVARILLTPIFFLISSLAWANDYPTKPVHLVIPFAAGGPTDVLARLISEELRGVWNQPLVIENKPGANAGKFRAAAGGVVFRFEAVMVEFMLAAA